MSSRWGRWRHAVNWHWWSWWRHSFSVLLPPQPPLFLQHLSLSTQSLKHIIARLPLVLCTLTTRSISASFFSIYIQESNYSKHKKIIGNLHLCMHIYLLPVLLLLLFYLCKMYKNVTSGTCLHSHSHACILCLRITWTTPIQCSYKPLCPHESLNIIQLH